MRKVITGITLAAASLAATAALAENTAVEQRQELNRLLAQDRASAERQVTQERFGLFDSVFGPVTFGVGETEGANSGIGLGHDRKPLFRSSQPTPAGR